MKFFTQVQFEPDEVQAFQHSMAGLTSLIEDEDGSRPAQSLLNRIMQEEALDAKAVGKLVEVLQEMINLLFPQTYVEWWHDQGAPGDDRTIEGLAQTRRDQVDGLVQSLILAKLARNSVGLAPLTRRERVVTGA